MTDLAKLRELVEKMTPGEWRVDQNRNEEPTINVPDDLVATFHHKCLGSLLIQRLADARGAAALRNAAPALLDELEQLRAVVAAVEKVEMELRADDDDPPRGTPYLDGRADGAAGAYKHAADLLAAALKTKGDGPLPREVAKQQLAEIGAVGADDDLMKAIKLTVEKMKP